MHKKECDDIKKLFEENDRNVIINASRKQETMQCIRAQNTSIKNIPTVRWYHIVRGQFHYMDKSILYIHLAVCISMVCFVWTDWYELQSWEKYGMIFSGVLGALSILETGSMFSQG